MGMPKGTVVLGSNIHVYIKTITGQDIPFTHKSVYLGRPMVLQDLTPSNAEWVQIALMLGRKLIITNWKASTLPAPSLWFLQLEKLAALEKL